MAAFVFDPDHVAWYEMAGWRAYYERRWLRLLWLTVGVCRAEFRIPFPQSWLAAYYVTRASLAWVPVDHNVWAVQTFLERFYRLARAHSGLRFDPARVGALELRYFDIHRRLVDTPDKGAFVETLVALHSALFGIPADQARPSAEARVRAATIVDRITSRRSDDVPGDWARIERALRACYRSIAGHLRQEGGAS